MRLQQPRRSFLPGASAMTCSVGRQRYPFPGAVPKSVKAVAVECLKVVLRYRRVAPQTIAPRR